MPVSIEVYIDRINACKSFPTLYKIGNDFFKDYVKIVNINNKETYVYADIKVKKVVELLDKKAHELIKKVIYLN